MNTCFQSPEERYSSGLFFKGALLKLLNSQENLELFRAGPAVFLLNNIENSLYSTLTHSEVFNQKFVSSFAQHLTSLGLTPENVSEIYDKLRNYINSKGQEKASRSYSTIQELNEQLAKDEDTRFEHSYNNYNDVDDWMGLRFSGSYQFGQTFTRDFINNTVIKKALVDTDPQSGGIVLETGTPDSPINRSYQTERLKQAMELLSLLKQTDNTLFADLDESLIASASSEEALAGLTTESYESYYNANKEVIQYLENNWDDYTEALFTVLTAHTVYSPQGGMSTRNPLEGSVLATYVSISENGSNSQEQEAAQRALELYQKAIFVADFDKVIGGLSKNLIAVIEESSRFDPQQIRYTKLDVENEVAGIYNKFETVDKMTTAPQAVSLIFENLNIYAYAQKDMPDQKPMKRFSPGISAIYNAFTKLTCVRQDGIQGINRAISLALADSTGKFTTDEKNILYSISKEIFSKQPGSIYHILSKSSNKTNEHLINVLMNDLHSTVLVRLAEASYDPATKRFKLINAEQRGMMGVNSLIRNELQTHLSNKSKESYSDLSNRFYEDSFTNVYTYKSSPTDSEGFAFASLDSRNPISFTKNDLGKLTEIFKILTGIDLNKEYSTGSSILEYLKGEDSSEDLYITGAKLSEMCANAYNLFKQVADTKGLDIIDRISRGDELSEEDLVILEEAKVGIIDGKVDLDTLKSMPSSDIKAINAKIADRMKGIAKDVYIITTPEGKREYRIRPTNRQLTAIASELTAARQAVTGEEVKTTTLNLEGNQEARFTNSNTAGNIKEVISIARRKANSLKPSRHQSVFTKNPFVVNTNLFAGMMKRSSIAKGEYIRPNSKASTLETFIFNVELGYFGKINSFMNSTNTDTEFTVLFDPTNYSDKTSNYLLEINQNSNDSQGVVLTKHSTVGTDGKSSSSTRIRPVEDTKDINNNTIKGVKTMHYESIRDHKMAFAANIVRDYCAIYEFMNKAQLLSVSVPPEVLAAINQVIAYNEFPLSDSIKAINFINSNLFDGKEYNVQGKSYDGSELLVEIASLAGIELVNYVHYNDLSASTFLKPDGSPSKSRIKPYIKDSILAELQIYENRESYDAYMSKIESNFCEGLEEIGYTFGTEAKNYISSKEFSNVYKEDGIDPTPIIYKNGKKELHPALKKYFYDYVYFSDNFMKLAVGDDNNQKDKAINFITGQEGITEETIDKLLGVQANQWVAQTKRNVSMTASMTMYTGGTFTGVNEGVRTAMIADITSQLRLITGNTETITDLDGGSYITMDHLLLIRNSLGTDYAPSLGIDQKSFISDVNSRTGYMTLIKHAAFAMTPGLIRASRGSSMSMTDMYRRMYEVHSLDGVDITKAHYTKKDGTPLNEFKDLYYYKEPSDFSTNEGTVSAATIYNILSINKVDGVPNQYTIQEINTDTNETEYREVTITNLFDLYEALGADKTLSPTFEKTSYSNSAETSYFKESYQVFEEIANFRNLMSDVPGLDGVTQILDLDSYSGTQLIPANTFERDYVTKLLALYDKLFPQLNGNIAVEHTQSDALLANKMRTLQPGEFADMCSQANLINPGDDLNKRKLIYNDLLKFLTQVVKAGIDQDAFVIKDLQYHKDKTIEMVSFAGAVKVGSINVNTPDKVSLLEKSWRGAASAQAIPTTLNLKSLETLKSSMINLKNGGAQLNTEHAIDHAELSIPTQMLNALVFGMKEAASVNTVLEALSSLVNEGIEEYLSVLGNPAEGVYSEDQIRAIQDKVSELMKEKYRTSENISISKIVAESFAHVPIDENKLSSDAVSTIASDLTKNSIKMKFDGILAVINPTSRSMQILEVTGGMIPVRNGNKYTLVSNAGRTTKLIGEDAEFYLNHRKNLLLANNTLTNEEVGYGPNDDPAALGSSSILLDATKNHGRRELAGPRLIMKISEIDAEGNEGEEQTLAGCLLDVNKPSQLETAQAMLGLKGALDMIGKESGYKQLDPLTIQSLNLYITKLNSTLADLKIEKLPKLAKSHNPIKQKETLLKLVDFHATVLQNHKYALDNEGNFAKPSRVEFVRSESLKIILNQLMQEDIDEMTQGRTPPNSLVLNNAWRNRKVKSIEVIPGEVIAPPIFYKNFLLRNGDKLNNIDADFFKRRLDSINEIGTLPVDSARILSLMHSSSGNHVYLVKQADGESIKETIIRSSGQEPTKIGVRMLTDSEGIESPWVVDSIGKKVFKLPSYISIYTSGKDDLYVYSVNDKLVLEDNRSNNFLEENDISDFVDNMNDSGKFGKITTIEPAGLERASERIKESNAKLAKEMEVSFKQQLKITGARIPGQHFQSFQSLEVVGFIEDKDAAVFVNTAVTLLSGSDFDIDKLNMIYSTINKSGRYEGWHPAFNLMSLKSSMDLPIPGNRSRNDLINRYMIDAFEDSSVYSDQLDSLEEMARAIFAGIDTSRIRSINEASSDVLNFENLTNRDLRKIQRALNANPHTLDVLNALYSLLDQDAKLNTNHGSLFNLLGIMDQHKLTINGLKNVIISAKDKIINSPKNYIMASTPMEMYVASHYGNELGDSSKVAKGINKLNPLSAPHQKKTNMDGKDGVGIFATALKAFSGISVALARGFKLSADLNDDAGANIIKKLGANIEINGVKYNFAGNVDISLLNAIGAEKLATNPKLLALYKLAVQNGSEEIKSLLRNLKDNELEGTRMLDLILLKEKAKNDCAQIKSQLISAATDNAKMLLLSKLNATTDTSKVYAMLAAMDVPFEEIVDLMTNPALVAVIKASQSNIFEEGKESISLDLVLTHVIKAATGKTKNNPSADYLSKLGIRINAAANTVTVNGVEYDGFSKIKEYKKLADTANEFSLLGTLFSINQGVKTDSYSIYSYEEKFNNFMQKTENNIKFYDLVTLINSYEDPKDALNDPILKSKIEGYKGNFNVPLILTLTPHFTRQMMVHVTANKILDNSSVTYRATRLISNALKQFKVISDTTKLSEDQHKAVENYVQDNFIHAFLNTGIGNQYSKVVIPQGDWITGVDKPLDAPRQLNLGNPSDRLLFMQWFENTVLYKLKDTYSRNIFVGDLTVDHRYDQGYASKVQYIRTGVNTSNPNNNNLMATYQAYEQGMKELAGKTYGQNNIIDMFYLYNMFCYKGRGRQGSWTRILERIYKVGDTVPVHEDNIMNQYFKFLQHIENNINEIQENQESEVGGNKFLFEIKIAGVSFNMKDLFSYYLASNTSRENITAYSGDINEFEEMDFDQPGDEDYAFDVYEEELGEADPNDFDYLDDENYMGAVKEAKVPVKLINRFPAIGTGTTMAVVGYGDNKTEFRLNTVDYPNKVVPISTNTNTIKFGEPKQSKDLSGKKDADSLKVLTEMVDRFRQINPDIKVVIAAEKDLKNMSEFTAHQLHVQDVRAALINGVVYINSDRASAGDVIHEFGHMALKILKTMNPEMYYDIINSARNDASLVEIRKAYPELSSEEDILEELFITKVGTLYDDSTLPNKTWYERFKDSINNFLNFVKDFTMTLMGVDVQNMESVNPIEFCGLKLDDMAKKFGDTLLQKSVKDLTNDLLPSDGTLLEGLSSAGIISIDC